MPCLLLKFVGRRYHATPWGHHVNEGLVEWPPSSWRLLRALLATGYSKLDWEGGPPPAAMGELLSALAGTLPVYHLPPAVTAHSRHYMPIGGGTTTKVLDTFAHVGDGTLAIEWDAPLTPASTALLGELADNLSYLGRAESWVEATVVPAIEPRADSYRVFPDSGQPQGRGWEQVSLLAPMSAPDYGAWRDAAVEQEKEAVRASGKPVNPAAVRKVNALFPEDLTACLTVATPWLQRQGWSQPPGSRRVLYWRPTAALEPPRPRSVPRLGNVPRQPAALLALSSDTQKKEVLPLFTRALPQAEMLHAWFSGWLERAGRREECPELTGRDADGQPMKGNQHAHYLPLSLAGNGRLDHVLIYAPMGLGTTAQELLGRVRETFSKGFDKPLFVTLAGFGTREDFARRDPAGFAVLGTSRVWRSLTPFVPPRFPKLNRHTIPEQVNAELAARDFPAATVSPMEKDEFLRADLHRFVRLRRNAERRPPVDHPFGLRLEFREPVTGPLALGYAAHFGLGLFLPEQVTPALSAG